MAKELPEVGDRIPVELLHISSMNARFEAPFGDAEEDQQLVANLRQGKVVQPFKVRPEGDGYGVVVGRRRFLAKKSLGTKSFLVGVDCLIEEMTDEEARRASLVENLEVFRKKMNPVARAQKLADIIAFSSSGLRGTAAELGLSPSTVSEWLKILELSPKIQDTLASGLLAFRDGLRLARMKLGAELQDELADVIENEGLEAFKRELQRLNAGKMKRGIPKDVYRINRVIWSKHNREEMGCYETLTKAAEKKGMTVSEYIKNFVVEHIEEIAHEIA